MEVGGGGVGASGGVRLRSRQRLVWGVLLCHVHVGSSVEEDPGFSEGLTSDDDFSCWDLIRQEALRKKPQRAPSVGFKKKRALRGSSSK